MFAVAPITAVFNLWPAVPGGQRVTLLREESLLLHPVWPPALSCSVWPVHFGEAHYSSAGEKRSVSPPALESAYNSNSSVPCYTIFAEESSVLLSTEKLWIDHCFTLCHLHECSH